VEVAAEVVAVMEVDVHATLAGVAEAVTMRNQMIVRSATSATGLGTLHGNAVRLIDATNVMALDTSPEIALEHQMNPCAITAVNLGILHGSVLRDVGKARPATTVANRAT